MQKETSVFDNPISEKRFLEYLETRDRLRFERAKAKEKILNSDNCTEQIINSVLELLC